MTDQRKNSRTNESRAAAAARKEELTERIRQIGAADQEAMKAARERQRQLAKVPGSLGKLEDISVRIAGITGKPYGNDVTSQGIAVFCGDSGVVSEGVASAPQSVTTSQMINFTRRVTGMSAMAAHFGIPVLDIDVGTKTPAPVALYTEDMLEPGGSAGAGPGAGTGPENLSSEREHEASPEGPGGMPGRRIARKIVDRRIAAGTEDLAEGPAMTEDQAVRAVLTGIEAADALKEAGVHLMGAGEMGIGNTTASSAVLTAITEIPAEMLVGRGGGLDDEGLARKIQVVERASDRCLTALDPDWPAHAPEDDDIRIPKPEADPARALTILSQLGSFELCAMTGAYLGAAADRVPAVLDGFISVTAACAAQLFEPRVTDFLFASHRSTETGTGVALKMLGLEPMFDLGMRLGEGSGCIPAFQIIEAACAAMNDMATLEEGAVDGNYLNALEEKDYD